MNAGIAVVSQAVAMEGGYLLLGLHLLLYSLCRVTLEGRRR